MRSKLPAPRIVQPTGFGSRMLATGLLTLVVFVLVASAFQLGRTQAVYQGMEAQRKTTDLQQELVLMRERNAKLDREVETLRGSREVNLGAIAALKADIAALEDERIQLEEELAVLRGVLGKGSVNGGLTIHDFELEPAEAEGGYIFKFTVSQTQKDFGVASGTIEIAVAGELKGEAKELTLADISGEKESSVKMRFRHFQNVSGQILLPAEFDPASFIVNVKPAIEGLEPVSRTFPWPKDRT